MPKLGVTGAIARTVSDPAKSSLVQSGCDRLAPFSISEGLNRLEDPLRHDFKGTRIGWLGDFDRYLALESGMITLCEDAIQIFEALECQIEAVRPSYSLGRLWEAWLTLRSWQVGGDLKRHAEDADRARLLRLQASWEIRSGSRLSAYDVYDALVARRAWCQRISELFEIYEYLLLPAAQAFPFDATWQWPKEIAGAQWTPIAAGWR